MAEFSRQCCESSQAKRNIVQKTVQTLLGFCLIGTCIAVVGAVLRTSNIQEREELGVLIHRSGMGVMLIGFGGLFLLTKKMSGPRKKVVFHWSDVNGRLSVFPVTNHEILDISVQKESRESIPNLDSFDLHGVLYLVAQGRAIDKEFDSRLAKLQQLRVLDLQNATLGDGTIQELELLASLEILLLAGCLAPSQAKELRIALPEARMIFDLR